MTDDWRVEAAARALFERDVRRSVGLAAGDYVWPRVAPEYRLAARAALEAADVAQLEQAAAAPAAPTRTSDSQGRVV